MLINQSLTHATLDLFSKQPEHKGQSDHKVASVKVQDRGTWYTPSQPNALEGVYADPRLSVPVEQIRSPVAVKALDTLRSIQSNEFKNLEAVYHRAVQAEIGRELNAGERLSVGDWQSMSGGLRRSGAEVNLLRVQLAVANGDFEHAGSIGFSSNDKSLHPPQKAKNALGDIATFRTLQVQNVLTKMNDGSFNDLVIKLGGQVNFKTESLGPLSDGDLKVLRGAILSEMTAQHKSN